MISMIVKEDNWLCQILENNAISNSNVCEDAKLSTLFHEYSIMNFSMIQIMCLSSIIMKIWITPE